MDGAIVVLNAGSSSLKFSVYRLDGQPGLELTAKGQIEGIGVAPQFLVRGADGTVLAEQRWDGPEGGHARFFKLLAEWLQDYLGDGRLRAVGHRVVHGGLAFAKPVLVDDDVLAQLDALCPLAPLHQPHNLAGIRGVAEASPDLPQVACFDTAFHRGHPDVAERFAIPRALHDEGVRRYGFHGLSYEYIARALKDQAPELAAGRVVVAHLGSGASMCALRGGRSMDSTMGFTALDGLPMGTRSGALDPGVLLHLVRTHGMDADGIERLLYHDCGLRGVSGISNDMRTLLASDDPRAAEAIDLFVYRIGRELGALTAALGGLDGLVFTAGIGERSAPIRARVCVDAGWLGITLDPDANERGGPRISTAAGRVSAWVIPTDEELMIATHTVAVLAQSTG